MLRICARILSPLAAVAVFAACSSGTTTPSPQATAKMTTDPTDVSFISGAAMSSNGEIGDAKLAIATSANTDVISFAQLMIKDHTTENDALDPIGTAVGYPPPTDVGPPMAAVTAMLKTLTGTAFDAAYIDSEITGHENNLANNYAPELSMGLDVQVKGYAGTYQPQVESHLTLAKSIKAKYGF